MISRMVIHFHRQQDIIFLEDLRRPVGGWKVLKGRDELPMECNRKGCERWLNNGRRSDNEARSGKLKLARLPPSCH
jgi:hypothetical protein